MTDTVRNQNGSITPEPKNELVFVPKAELVRKQVQRLTDGRQLFAVTDENVQKLHPEILPEHNLFVLPAGEDGKTLASVQEICRAMLQTGMTRGCIVAAFGGGVVGDLAGFAASVYMRGVQFVNVPTTLLSQVDSAIGGKTGVNLDNFKNMIGSFHMPTHIVICPELLATLPQREWRCGMGELIKTAALCPELCDFVNGHIHKLVARDPFRVEKAVALAARFKKDITDNDPNEKGRRAILNFGHTVGHALEKCDNHKLSHGEYVLLGMHIELAMARGEFCYHQPFADRIDEWIRAVGLPPLPACSAEEVTAAAKADKKNENGNINVIGLIGAGMASTVPFSAKSFCERYEAATKNFVKGARNNV